MPGVTISSGFGAGGSVVAPAVARQLGLPLLDRAISSRVAAQLRVSLQEAEDGAPQRSLAVGSSASSPHSPAEPLVLERMRTPERRARSRRGCRLP